MKSEQQHKREILYQEYVHREEQMARAPYIPELSFYTSVQNGDVKEVRVECEEPFSEKAGLGVLSPNRLQSLKYHFTITAALLARYCIEGGMEVSVAYGLSDYYISEGDQCQNVEELNALHLEMCLDYTKRMKSLRKMAVQSKPVSDCLDYIYNHLHEKIRLADLAEESGMNGEYLGKLFRKEMGVGVNDYVMKARLQTAANLLAHSEYSLPEISETLAFSSQSYFTAEFKKFYGTTPKKYREENWRKMY